MIWFNIKRIEEKLKDGEVSDKEGLYYLTANTLLYTLGSYIATRDDKSSGWFYGELIFAIAITIYGVFKTYDINKDGDDLDYFKRFQALVFVVGMRLLVLILVVMIIAALVFYRQPEVMKSPLSGFAIAALANLVFYYNLCNSFKRVTLVDQ